MDDLVEHELSLDEACARHGIGRLEMIGIMKMYGLLEAKPSRDECYEGDLTRLDKPTARQRQLLAQEPHSARRFFNWSD